MPGNPPATRAVPGNLAQTPEIAYIEEKCFRRLGWVESQMIRREGLRGLFRSLFLLLLLTGFPLLCTDVAIQYLLSLKAKNSADQIFSELDNELFALQPLTNQERTIQEALEKLAGALKNRQVSIQGFRHLEKQWAKRFPGLFSFVLFNPSGKLLSEPGPGTSRRILERIFSDFQLLRAGRAPLFKTYWPLIEQSLGIINQKVVFSPQKNWYRTSKRHKNTWLYVFFGGHFSFFLHIHEGALPPMLGIKSRLHRQPPEATLFHLFDVQHRRFFSHPAVWHRADLRSCGERVLSDFDREPETHFHRDGRWWSVLMLSPRFRLLASRADTQTLAQRHLLAWFRVGSILFLLAIHAMFLFLLSRETLPFVPLRAKLVGLFLLSSGLPLLMLFFTGGAYLEERKTGLLQDTRQKSQAVLKDFDAKQPAVNAYLQKRVQNLLKELKPGAPGWENRLEKTHETLKRRLHAHSFKLIADSGKTLYPRIKRRKESPEDKFVIALVMKVLRQLVSARHQSDDPLLRGGDLILSSMLGQDMDSVAEDFIRDLGRITSLELATQRVHVLMDVLKDSEGLPEYIYSMKWEDADIFQAYFQRALPLKPLLDGSRILAVSTVPERLRYHPGLPIRFNPGETPPRFLQIRRYYPNRLINRPLERFIRKALRAKRTIHGSVFQARQDYLLTSLPGSNLKNFVLFRMVPLLPLTEEINRLRFSLGLFGVLSLAFTTSLGMLLAAKVLKPIRDLSEGVLAVREQHLQHRVPKQDPDELGDLAEMFNRMTESLQEVATAKLVQDALFPQTALTVGDYTVLGVSWPASELGGDYFDYLPMKDDGLLILTGDVTGHGVPAALVMAMSKSLVLAMVQQGNTPFEILTVLNRVIHETVQKKKRIFMTLGAFFLNTRTHEGFLYNCGHCFPYLRHNDGTIELLRIAGGAPMGIRGRFSCDPLPLTLAPGEQLCFYTDGLPESISYERDANNFELLGDFIESRPRLPLVQTPQDILRNHPFILTGKPQPDDFTVVCLERSGGASLHGN
jgi:serine phosphatase RsbU (regulator of sigma subunit)